MRLKSQPQSESLTSVVVAFFCSEHTARQTRVQRGAEMTAGSHPGTQCASPLPSTHPCADGIIPSTQVGHPKLSKRAEGPKREKEKLSLAPIF